jgi:hypothetical protein
VRAADATVGKAQLESSLARAIRPGTREAREDDAASRVPARAPLLTVGCARTCRQQAEKGDCDGESHNLRAKGVGRLFRIRPAGYVAASLDSGMAP